MSNRHFYVKVTECLTVREFTPFSSHRPRKPGQIQSWRVFGPYTYNGAQRVAKTALEGMDDITNSPQRNGTPSLSNYAHDEYGTRVASVYPYNPDQLLKPTRHMPKGY